MGGRNLSIKIPGFGEVVMELIGLCDCNCSATPVGSQALSLLLSLRIFRRLTVHSVMTAMVVLYVDNVFVMRDGECVYLMVCCQSLDFSLPRVGEVCECDASNISVVSCPYVCLYD